MRHASDSHTLSHTHTLQAWQRWRTPKEGREVAGTSKRFLRLALPNGDFADVINQVIV